MSAPSPIHAQPLKASPAPAPAGPVRRCACGGVIERGGECSACRAKQERVLRQGMGPAPSTVPRVVHQLAAQPGRALEPATREFMEVRFGHDFGRVRVHDDDGAARATRSVNAIAFTVGQAIAFSPGAYATQSADGRRLLAHELAHVVQQGRGGVEGAESTLESEAARAGDAISRGAPANVAGSAPVMLQRQAVAATVEPDTSLEDDPLANPTRLPLPAGWEWGFVADPAFTSMPTADMARRLLAGDAGPAQIAACQVSLHGAPGRHAYWSFRHPERGEICRVIGESVQASEPGAATTQRYSVTIVYQPPPSGKPGSERGKPGGTVSEPKGNAKPEQTLGTEDSKTDPAAKQPGGGTLASAMEHARKTADEPNAPVTGDLSVFNDATRAEFYLFILEHFAARSITDQDRAAAADGLSPEEVAALIAGEPLRRALTDLYTQGYRDFTAAGGSDFEHFKLLIQTIDEQFTRGNPNAVRNMLKIGVGVPEAETLGIVLRTTDFLCYDQFGVPLPSFSGVGYRDKGYVGSRNDGEPGININDIDDVAVRGLLNSLRQSFSDPTRMAIEAAQIYYANVERVNAEVRSGLSKEVLDKFEEMLVPFIGFIAGQAISSFLARFPNPQVAAIGLVLKGLLTGAGYLLDIQFAGEAMQRLLRAAAELIKVEKNDKGQFTRLSEAHLKNAAVPIRQMVADVALMGTMHALGAMVRLAAKGLGKLRLECTTCKLEETVAREQARQKENVPPERPPVEVPDTTRGFSIEDQHVPSQGYQSLREAGSVKGIDGIKGGDFEPIVEQGQVIKKYTRPDGLSVKSTRIVDPTALRRKIQADLKPLRGRYEHRQGNYWIDGLRQRRLDLVFEEGVYHGFTLETLNVLETARAESGSVQFHWFVWVQGSKIPDVTFLRDFSHLVPS